jgi:hypothetical protein
MDTARVAARAWQKGCVTGGQALAPSGLVGASTGRCQRAALLEMRINANPAPDKCSRPHPTTTGHGVMDICCHLSI